MVQSVDVIKYTDEEYEKHLTHKVCNFGLPDYILTPLGRDFDQISVYFKLLISVIYAPLALLMTMVLHFLL